jgi:DNA-directed RNA polymerase specialized sigma24 family protein
MKQISSKNGCDRAGDAEDHLAERAAAGDTEAMEALLASLRPWALQLAGYRMIGHRGHITPDTLLNLWRRIRDYEPGRPVRAWVRVMLERRIHSVRRQRLVLMVRGSGR